MLPSIDLTKLAFHYDLRHPGVAVGGGALLGAGLGAGIGALTADPEEGQSRWQHAGAGALLGGALGAGVGAGAARWPGKPGSEAPSLPKKLPQGPGPNVNEMLASRSSAPAAPVPAPVAQAPVAPAPVTVQEPAPAPVRAVMAHHDGGPDVLVPATGKPGFMESLISGEHHAVDPSQIVGDAGTVDEANAALMQADYNHPIMKHLGGEDMKTSSFWATELAQLKSAQIMRPGQYAHAMHQFDANDVAAYAPHAGAAVGAGAGLLASRIGGKTIDPETGEEVGPSATRQAIGTGLGAALGGMGGMLAKKRLTVTPNIA